jgi:hypothetical protein
MKQWQNQDKMNQMQWECAPQGAISEKLCKQKNKKQLTVIIYF